MLEMLATLAVAALTLSIGVPGLRSFVLSGKQTAAINDMVASMHYARAEAVNRNRRVTVCTSSDGQLCSPTPWQQGWLVFVDADADRQVGADDEILRSFAGQDQVRVASPTLSGYFIYRPNGRLMVDGPDEATAELFFCDDRGPAHARAVVVPNSGRPMSGDRGLHGQRPGCV